MKPKLKKLIEKRAKAWGRLVRAHEAAETAKRKYLLLNADLQEEAHAEAMRRRKKP